MLKKTLISTLMVASLGGISQLASAEVYVRVAPPAPRAEIVPQPRRGYVWNAGHWEWRRQQHVWVGGTWIRDRPGYSYSAPTWVERDGRWAMQSGRWNRGGRDRDGDGVRNGRDRDRDGDGVPNRMDNRPNDPTRR